MALTGKKRVFADAVLAGKSNKDAAIEAGYSAKTAAQAGSRLVKDPKVAEYLAKARKSGQNAGYTTPDGTKAPSAPAGWPFGTEPPPPPPDAEPKQFDDPREYLKHVMNDAFAEPKERLEAAKALLPFEHARLAPQGKKDAKKEAAAKASGRFAPAAPPRMVVNNDRK